MPLGGQNSRRLPRLITRPPLMGPSRVAAGRCEGRQWSQPPGDSRLQDRCREQPASGQVLGTAGFRTAAGNSRLQDRCWEQPTSGQLQRTAGFRTGAWNSFLSGRAATGNWLDVTSTLTTTSALTTTTTLTLGTQWMLKWQLPRHAVVCHRVCGDSTERVALLKVMRQAKTTLPRGQTAFTSEVFLAMQTEQ